MNFLVSSLHKNITQRQKYFFYILKLIFFIELLLFSNHICLATAKTAINNSPIHNNNSINSSSLTSNFHFQKTLPRNFDFNDQNRIYSIEEKINDLGEYEVVVSLKKENLILPDISQELFIGRSLTLSQKVEIWFIPSENGVFKPIPNPVETQGDLVRGVKYILDKELQNADQWFTWLALKYIGQHLSLALDHDHEFEQQIQLDQLNLIDLEQRLLSLSKINPNDPLLKEGYSLLYEGWVFLQQKIQNENNNIFWGYVAGDVTLTLVGGKVLHSFSHWLGRIGPELLAKYSLTENGVYKTVEHLALKMQKSVNDKIDYLRKKLYLKSYSSLEKQATAAFLATIPVRVKVIYLVKSLQHKSLLAKHIINTFTSVLSTMKNGIGQAKYIALTQSLQLTSEIMARPEDLFDPNPIILGSKLTQDKDFMQNFLYMTNETFWMSAIASRPNLNFTKKFLLCGVVASIDSLAMNLVIKSNVDQGRIALDSLWEVFAGNLQTQLDMRSIKLFEGLSAKLINPKLELVGYMVAMVDQGAGYWGYAKISKAYEDGKLSQEKLKELVDQQITFKIIPVLAHLTN